MLTNFGDFQPRRDYIPSRGRFAQVWWCENCYVLTILFASVSWEHFYTELFLGIAPIVFEEKPKRVVSRRDTPLLELKRTGSEIEERGVTSCSQFGLSHIGSSWRNADPLRFKVLHSRVNSPSVPRESIMLEADAEEVSNSCLWFQLSRCR